jgi:hypothetical protein
MSAMKNLISSIMELLEKTHMDYEYVATVFNMNPIDVYTIAKEYGDVE